MALDENGVNQDGYKTTDRIPEPGRNVYLNMNWMF